MSNPNCDMPDCAGGRVHETKAVRDVSGNLIEMCEGCLEDGWDAHVEVLE